MKILLQNICCEVLSIPKSTSLQDIQDDAISEFAGFSLALALFLDTMWNERPAKRMEASPWYESAANLACRLLSEKTEKAPKVISISALLFLLPRLAAMLSTDETGS